MQKPSISYEVFSQLDIRIATVRAAAVVEGADRLLKLTLDAGELGECTVVSGIREWYSPENIVGKQVLYLCNLEPRMLRGVESKGMIIAAGAEEAILVHPDKEVPAGTPVR